MAGGSTNRRRRISALSFLFVLAVCAAFAAHERLHDLELAAHGHPSGHHETVVHDHPALASAAPLTTMLLVAVGGAFATPGIALAKGHPALASAFRAGPVIDDDVGLHDVLSVYRI